MLSSQPWQAEVGPDGELRAVVRYAVDRCVCGHTWAEHYQPRVGRKAACYAQPKGRLCDCHAFMLAH